MVYVLNIDGQPLMPTERHGKVRRLLNSASAKVEIESETKQNTKFTDSDCLTKLNTKIPNTSFSADEKQAISTFEIYKETRSTEEVFHTKS